MKPVPCALGLPGSPEKMMLTLTLKWGFRVQGVGMFMAYDSNSDPPKAEYIGEYR